MKHEPQITIQDNTIFLSLDLKGLDLYQRGKAIRRFINSDTKIVEDYADRLCKLILNKNGIKLKDMSDGTYLDAMLKLQEMGKTIQIVDFYANTNPERCEYLRCSENHITVLIEDNRYLQCGVEVKEVNYERSK